MVSVSCFSAVPHGMAVPFMKRNSVKLCSIQATMSGTPLGSRWLPPSFSQNSFNTFDQVFTRRFATTKTPTLTGEPFLGTPNNISEKTLTESNIMLESTATTHLEQNPACSQSHAPSSSLPWNDPPEVLHEQGPVFFLRFPNFSMEYPEGSHPAEIMELCRKKAMSALIAPVAGTLEQILPVDIIFQFLMFWQSQLGFSCTKSIVATAVLFRTLLLPLTLAVERSRRKTSLHEPTLRAFREKLTSKSTTSPQEIQKLASQYRKEHGLSLIPKTTVLQQLIQLPILLTFWNCIHIIGSHPEQYRQFTMEAPLWLTSLCLPDPLYIFPVFFAVLLVMQLELTSATDRAIQTRAYVYRKHATLIKENAYLKRSRFFSLMGRLSGFFSLFMTSRLPGGLLLYMTTNLACQVFVAAGCRVPAIEKFLGLPPAQLNVKQDLIRIFQPFWQNYLSPYVTLATRFIDVNTRKLPFYRVLIRRWVLVLPTFRNALAKWAPFYCAIVGKRYDAAKRLFVNNKVVPQCSAFSGYVTQLNKKHQKHDRKKQANNRTKRKPI